MFKIIRFSLNLAALILPIPCMVAYAKTGEFGWAIVMVFCVGYLVGRLKVRRVRDGVA